MKKISYVLGIAVLSLSLASCKGIGSTKTEEVEKPTYKVVEKVIEVEKPVYVEKEVIIEIEKPKYVEKEVEKEVVVEKPVYVEKEVEYPTYIKTEYVEVEKIVEKPIYVKTAVVSLETLDNVEVEKLGENLYRYEINTSNLKDSNTLKLFNVSSSANYVDGHGLKNGEWTSKPGMVIKDIEFGSSEAMIVPQIFNNHLHILSEHTLSGNKYSTIIDVSKTYENINEEEVKIKVLTETIDGLTYYGPEKIWVSFSLTETNN